MVKVYLDIGVAYQGIFRGIVNNPEGIYTGKNECIINSVHAVDGDIKRALPEFQHELDEDINISTVLPLGDRPLQAGHYSYHAWEHRFATFTANLSIYNTFNPDIVMVEVDYGKACNFIKTRDDQIFVQIFRPLNTHINLYYTYRFYVDDEKIKYEIKTNYDRFEAYRDVLCVALNKYFARKAASRGTKSAASII